MPNARLRGVYAITDPRLCGDQLLPKVEAALAGGIRLLQYRNKTAPPEQQAAEAAALAALCRRHDVLFLINDDVELARRVDADGVHLGQRDAALREARAALGADRIIGITCHNRLDYALTAQRAGADYVAFGRFFASKTKPDAPAADPALLDAARDQLDIPVCAIGGLTPANAAPLLARGAAMLAVIHGIFGAADVQAAARQYAELFNMQRWEKRRGRKDAENAE
jgi:thiamine-phosphate pyrophosphorylase